jgi:hypothetical protein
MGMDVRFQESSAVIRNNLLTGRIKERDGGTSLADHNLVADSDDFADWFAHPEKGDFKLLDGDDFVDKGIESELSKNDFCNKARTGKSDIGAIEYADGEICKAL